MESNNAQTSLFNIHTEVKNAKAARTKLGSQFFSNPGKGAREWDILGAVCELMQKASIQPPVYAKKSEAPDFYLFNGAGKNIGRVEIVEVLRPGERRHQKFKEVELAASPKPYFLSPAMNDPLLPLREQILKKAQKKYAHGTKLIVYFNILHSSFPNMDRSVLEQVLEQHAHTPFQGCDQFEEVLVLNSSMNALAMLHPNPHIIFSA